MSIIVINKVLYNLNMQCHVQVIFKNPQQVYNWLACFGLLGDFSYSNRCSDVHTKSF